MENVESYFPICIDCGDLSQTQEYELFRMFKKLHDYGYKLEGGTPEATIRVYRELKEYHPHILIGSESAFSQKKAGMEVSVWDNTGATDHAKTQIYNSFFNLAALDVLIESRTPNELQSVLNKIKDEVWNIK